ncbi:UNVERIFIED_CONTAM: hypothetical protein HDU68_002975 [Siphonaria sp. JEL0065]|nr:hypothetical protein HDU68_002975 [Siphonaria sp. JEL0065]
MSDPLDAFPTLFINGLPPNITEFDIVNVMSDNKIEAKVVVDRDPITHAPLTRVVFRYVPDAERFFATVNGSAFLGSKVHLTFKDPNMNFSNTSGSKTIVVKRIPLNATSLELYDLVRKFGRIIFCKVMMDRGGLESYALLQFEEQAAAEICIQEMNGFVVHGGALSFNWQFPKNSNHIYPSMRSNSAPIYNHLGAPSNLPYARQSQIPAGLEGGISLAVSAGWSEQPLGDNSTASPYGSYNNNSDQQYSQYGSSQPHHPQSWMRNNSVNTYSNSYKSIDFDTYRTSSPVPSVNAFTPPPPITLNILPTTGWHSRNTVNTSLIVSNNNNATERNSEKHAWDEAMTITLEDLKSISPAHAVLASQYDPTPPASSQTSPTSAAETYVPLSSSNKRDSYNTLPSPTSSSSSASIQLDPRNLYVKNLPIDPIFDTQDLYELFGEYGQIISAKVMKDENTWVSKGFGFVSFRDEAAAREAVEGLNGFVLDPVAVPKGLVVCVAEPKGFRERKLMVLHGNALR